MKWAKLLRRCSALLFAMAAVWWLASAGDAAERVLALATPTPSQPAPGALGFWERVALGQSPYLRRGRVLTAPLPSPSVSRDDGQGEELYSPSATEESSDEEETPIPQSAVREENVVSTTLLPVVEEGCVSADGAFLYNRTGLPVDVEALSQVPISLSGQEKGPQILIVHTHATEAYTQSDQDVYTESDPYRTTDTGHNVVHVGDEIAAVFAQAGLNVLHDRTLHDYPNYNGAYGRSRTTVQEYLDAFPSIRIVLDVHRDALVGEDGVVFKAVADDSVVADAAQVMLVVGSNAGGSDHPGWSSNLALAMAIERALNEGAPTLARPVTLRSACFNQDLTPGSLLVEVGSHGNSLQESVTAARTFARLAAPVIAQVLAA